MADRPPPLRLVPAEEDGEDGGGERPANAPLVKRKLPKHLYLPAPTMKTIWCRFSIGGFLHRQSTGCRDVRNAERRATAIRAELEAEAQGIAKPKRILLKDAVSDFGRHIATGRGGKDRQEKNIRLLRTGASGAASANFAEQNSQ